MDDYREIQLDYPYRTSADVIGVEILEQCLVTEEPEDTRDWEELTLEVTLGLKCRINVIDTITNVEQVFYQNTLDGKYEHYLRVNTVREEDVISGGFAYDPEYVKFTYQVQVARRKKPENEEEWDLDAVTLRNEYLHFDSGMQYGVETWLMTELDLSDVTNAKLTILGRYAYVNATVVDPDEIR